MRLDERNGELPGTTRTFMLWYGILAGPVVWLVHLFVSYGLATTLCSAGQVVGLHVAMGVASLVAVSAGLVGWRVWVRLRDVATDEEEDVAVRRARFMAIFAMGSSLIFLIAIVSQSLPNFFLDPCRYLP